MVIAGAAAATLLASVAIVLVVRSPSRPDAFHSRCAEAVSAIQRSSPSNPAQLNAALPAVQKKIQADLVRDPHNPAEAQLSADIATAVGELSHGVWPGQGAIFLDCHRVGAP